MNPLVNRIIDISYKYNLSHIGSCLSTLPILEEIYRDKDDQDAVVLSNGHAGLAQYVILEKLYGYNAEKLLEEYGIHPCRDISKNIQVSSGSLGCGLAISTGIALANRNKKVYCVISDGECAEGIIWEALSFAHLNKLDNLKVHVNINGYSAYDVVDKNYLEQKLKSFLLSVKIWNTSSELPFAKGIDAHYKTIKENDYNEFINLKYREEL